MTWQEALAEALKRLGRALAPAPEPVPVPVSVPIEKSPFRSRTGEPYGHQDAVVPHTLRGAWTQTPCMPFAPARGSI